MMIVLSYLHELLLMRLSTARRCCKRAAMVLFECSKRLICDCTSRALE